MDFGDARNFSFLRCGEIFFEGRELGHGKVFKDAAAMIVDDYYGQVSRELMGCEQSVGIMKEGEVSREVVGGGVGGMGNANGGG